MNKLPRITEIIKTEPFKIISKWTTGEVLVTDFELFFNKWKKDNYILMYPLMNYNIFKYVSISETKTFQWVNIPIEIKSFTGSISKMPLDICPDTIYSISKPIQYYKLVPVEIFETEDIVFV